ncbi:ATP-grasp domain-containing protein [Hyunsoonleella pacifica]|uniref:ATP-grasp domain-containing protein n=1 Tax=Hyunsoonleella pacifica TaxID=1080224 RepID=A0A4Q9FQK7_9FLAO|nr:hypothetical protein [Hyunsoonleella pacifica]TBN17795.1 hypothetical protein EYD46_05645 [Hyunsoonleella pacifica]GGD08897.1 hypothetical protein GCM10011368_08530 [Hyunsoonleella pacifica]
MALLGIDLILDEYRQWHILEVNDHPTGLYLADQLLNTSTQFSKYLSRNGIDKIAEKLISKCRNKAIVLLLPDCFRIKNGFSNRPISITDNMFLGDYRIEKTLEDFNALLTYLNGKKIETFIADFSSIKQVGSKISLKSIEVGAMYRRSSQFPKNEPDCFCLNDLRLRAICPDKKQLAELLIDVGLSSNCLIYHDFNNAYTLAEEWLISGQSIIIKPEKGSASVGIQKVSSIKDLKEKKELLDKSKDSSNMIFQKWIEPSKTFKNGKPYYYDIRINILDGKVISGFGRSSAAPCEDVSWSETPLVWLTTTGKVVPLAIGENKVGKTDTIYLSEQEMSQLETIAGLINLAVHTNCDNSFYNDTTKKIGNFKSQEGIKDKMHYIFLE